MDAGSTTASRPHDDDASEAGISTCFLPLVSLAAICIVGDVLVESPRHTRLATSIAFCISVGYIEAGRRHIWVSWVQHFVFITNDSPPRLSHIVGDLFHSDFLFRRRLKTSFDIAARLPRARLGHLSVFLHLFRFPWLFWVHFIH
jgi:hypothetical protein